MEPNRIDDFPNGSDDAGREAYRTAWRAEDQSERKRIIEILKRATEELENLGTARQA